MNEFYRPTWVEVHLDFLSQNYLKLKSLSSHHFFCPMVKSNAYGHGSLQIVRQLKLLGQTIFGVALIEEGIFLRNELSKNDYKLLLFGFFDKKSVSAVFEYNLTPVVSTEEQLILLKQEAEKRNEVLPIHIKFDTGMNRAGFELEDLDRLLEKGWFQDPFLPIHGLCTHLADGERVLDGTSFSYEQILHFKSIEEKLSFLKIRDKHLFNSAGFLSFHYLQRPEIKSYGFRPGLSIYGIHPELTLSKDLFQKHDLRPVMSLHSRVVMVNRVKKGETVSYGRRWSASTDSFVAIIPVGYADGFSRDLSNKASLCLLGQRVDVVGSVTMDYTMIDVTTLIRQGMDVMNKEVILFSGDGDFSVSSLAEKANTIPYELLTNLGRRIPRLYK